MPMAPVPGASATFSMRMKARFTGRLKVSTTLPPRAFCAAAFALKLGLLGSSDHEPDLGTVVSPAGPRATESSHAGFLASFESFASFLSLPRAALRPDGSRPVGFVFESPALLHPASARTAAISPAPPHLMAQP